MIIKKILSISYFAAIKLTVTSLSKFLGNLLQTGKNDLYINKHR
ncbi:hypothetical protein B6N60_03466 [Richelia sinica FACHB-800]|uniref:Uncharacterized protein n=1 Tax=Richelia sinica FACHB-800 TaxID=1357546 RepID=A0A975TB36_9NOST|nr:hypothetical protein B6N60_03466 [Richelia sinica FACHB-800]